MKSVLISIQPKWCELIANGKKTVEVRKTRPKIDVPFKCYIYCTQGDALAYPCLNNSQFAIHRMIDSRSLYGRQMTPKEREESDYTFANGKVIGEFVCDSIMPYCRYEIISGVSEAGFEELTRATQLSRKELYEYCGEKDIYCWHISDLVIYEQPKELSEFCRYDNTYDNAFGYAFEDRNKYVPITRPPQSWCYVEGVEGK